MLRVLNEEETIVLVLEGNSIARFGDGEYRIMNGEDIYFQPYEEILSARLKQIIASRDILVAIPPVFDEVDVCRIIASSNYISKCRRLINFLDMENVYGSSLISRLDMVPAIRTKNYLDMIDKLWANQDVCVITSIGNRDLIASKIASKTNSLAFIFAPPVNAFSSFSKIMSDALVYPKKTRFLISLGPCAKLIVYDLSIHGYQAIDTGHMFSNMDKF